MDEGASLIFCRDFIGVVTIQIAWILLQGKARGAEKPQRVCLCVRISSTAATPPWRKGQVSRIVTRGLYVSRGIFLGVADGWGFVA